jgi:hypothetical protein
MASMVLNLELNSKFKIVIKKAQFTGLFFYFILST